MAQPRTVREIESLINKLAKLTETADAAAVAVAELEAEGKDATEARKAEKKAKAAQKVAQDQFNKSVGDSSQAFEDLIDNQRKFKISLEQNSKVFDNLGIGAQNLAKVFESSTDTSGMILQEIATRKAALDTDQNLTDIQQDKIKEEIELRTQYNKMFSDSTEVLAKAVQDLPTSIGFGKGTTIDFEARAKRRQEAMQLPTDFVNDQGDVIDLQQLALDQLTVADRIEDFSVDVNRKMALALKPAEELKSKITGITDKIPLIGGAISTFINDKFSQAVNIVGEEFTKSLMQQVGGTKAIGKGITGNIGLQTVFNAVTNMNPYAKIAALVIAVATALATVLTISRKIGRAQRDLANELSIGKDQLDGQLIALKGQELRFKALNLDADKLKTTLTTLSSEFKDLSLVTAENAANIEMFAQNAGIGGDEVAKLNKQLMISSGLSFDQALSLQQGAAAMAEAAGVASGRVLADMAASAEDFAEFSRSGADGLAEAAVAAANVGLNLDKVLKVAEGLINIETSLTKEFEAQVLTGRVLNLEKARQAAFAGNEQALIAEIQSQVGGVGDFEAMSIVQKQAISEAIGLSVSDIMRLQRGESLDKQDTQISLQKENIDVLRNGFLGNKEELRKLNEKGDGAPGLYGNVETAI